MKKRFLFISAVLVVIISACIITYTINSHLAVTTNTKILESKLLHDVQLTKGQVKDLIDLSYDKVYVFEPYASKELMQSQLGFKCRLLKETVNEAMLNILFIHNDSPIAYLYGLPSNNGYYIKLPVGVYTKAEMDKMHYTLTESEISNSDDTIQTYLYYVFTK